MSGDWEPSIKKEDPMLEVPYGYILWLFPERRPSRTMDLYTMRILVVMEKRLYIYSQQLRPPTLSNGVSTTDFRESA